MLYLIKETPNKPCSLNVMAITLEQWECGPAGFCLKFECALRHTPRQQSLVPWLMCMILVSLKEVKNFVASVVADAVVVF